MLDGKPFFLEIVLGFEIITLSPTGYFLLCAAIALGLTWLLYRKHFFSSQWKTWLMRVLRFLGLFLVFCLLLSPMVKIKLQKEKKPQLLVYKDYSWSIDSLAMAALWGQYETQKETLAKHFDIKEFKFDGGVLPLNDSGGNRNETRLSEVFEHANGIGSAENAVSTLLISDGIYNSGIHPLFKNLNRNMSLYAIGLGDTQTKPDMMVTEVNANSSVFYKNDFIVSAALRMLVCKGQNAEVQLLDNGKVIQKKQLLVQSDPFFTRLDFVLQANAVGNHRYTVKIVSGIDDHNLLNNENHVFVTVTDTRRKVDICYFSPHPDVGAITRALEQFEQYQVKKVKGVSGNPDEADIYIMHGLPNDANSQQFVQKLIQNRKAVWYIYTAQSNSMFAKMPEMGIQPMFQTGVVNDAQAVLSPQFTEYILENEWAEELKGLPPLSVPVGNVALPNSFKTMLLQKIGNVETDYPLMGYNTMNGVRNAWLWGEGIWKWRMRDLRQNGNSTHFDQWVAGIIQYISSDEVKNRFRIFTSKPLYYSVESIALHGEYMDQNKELNNPYDATAEIKGDNGKTAKVALAKNGKRYLVEWPSLPPGNYTVSARLNSPTKDMAQAEFTVLASNPELENTVADFSLLRKLAARNHGAFANSSGLNALIEQIIKDRGDKTYLVSETSVTELIQLKWIFGLIVLLFSAEWFLRKREGGY